MQERFFKFHLDFIGFSASLLCAIHCISLPIILSLSTLGGLAWLENEAIELSFIACSVIVASWSLFHSYFRVHSRKEALLIAFTGFSIIIISHVFFPSLEPILMMFAGISIAWAHWLNWRLVNQVKKMAYQVQ